MRLLKEVIPLDILFAFLYFLIIDGKCTSDIVNSSVIGGTLESICLFCMTYVFKMKLNWRYHNWRYLLIYIMSDLTTNATFRNIFTWVYRRYYKAVRTISTFNFTHINIHSPTFPQREKLVFFVVVFWGSFFHLFCLKTGKYRPWKTLHLNSFHTMFGSSSLEVFYRKSIPKNFENFTEKHLYQSLFFDLIKLQTWGKTWKM